MAIASKKKVNVLDPTSKETLLQRLNYRLKTETTPETCKEIIHLLIKDFGLPKDKTSQQKANLTETKKRTAKASFPENNLTELEELATTKSKVKEVSKIESSLEKTLPPEIKPILVPKVQTELDTKNSKTAKILDQTEAQSTKSPIEQKKEKSKDHSEVLNTANRLKQDTNKIVKKPKKTKTISIKSDYFSLACYLLGRGSLSWMIVFAMIPLLMNLNISDLFIEYNHLSSSKKYTEGRVIGTTYARMSGLDELVEVHYHYIVDHKNFTGFSYLINQYLPQGHKVNLVISESNPKISRIKKGSFTENAWFIYLFLFLMLCFMMTGILGSLSAKDTHIKDLSMIEDTSSAVLQHFLIRRFSIVLSLILFCTLFSFVDFFYDIFYPLLEIVGSLAIIILGTMAVLSESSND